MKKFILICFLFTYSLSLIAGQNIICKDPIKGSRSVSVNIKFSTEDLSKTANILIKGDGLFNGKIHAQDSCKAFTTRGRKYYNSFAIHNYGCDIWHCTLFTPDTIHGEELENFDAKFQCFPADSNQNIWVKFDLVCSTTIEN